MKILRRASADGGSATRPGAPWRAWWLALAQRERRLAVAGLLVLGLGLMWMLALAPALRTLRTAPAALQALDMERQRMQVLAEETQRLRGIPPVSRDQATAALKSAAERLGDSAKLSLQGDRAVLTLTALQPSVLDPWLAEVRAGARASPLQANLVRGANGYSGTLVLAVGGTP